MIATPTPSPADGLSSDAVAAVAAAIADGGIASVNDLAGVGGDGGGVALRPAGTSIVLDGAADYAPLTIAGATTIAIGGTTRGAAAQMMVLANGTNVPTITGADEWASSFGFLNTSGIPNRLDAWYDGFARRYAWSQQLTPSVIDLTAPTLSAAAVNGASLVLTYSEALDATAPAASAWSVVGAGGVTQTPSAVSISGSAVTLTLATPAVSANTVTISYTVPGSNPIRDSAGNSAAALASQAVTNNTAAPGSEATFTLGALNLLTNSSGTYTGGAGATGWAPRGRSGSGLSLASGADGWVSIERANGTLENVVIAWHTADTATEQTATLVCMQINRTGAGSNPDTILIGAGVLAGVAATVAGSTAAAAAGVRYRLGRAGSVWTVQQSLNDGASWSVVYTVTGVTSTAQVYPVLFTTANNAIRNVKQSGLT